jgi:hypothetical protein
MAYPSQLETILTIYQQWQFSINNGTVTRVINTPALNLQSATPASMTLPTRITAPGLGKVSMKVEKTSFGLGGGRCIIHTIEDMMLWAPLTQELAPADEAYMLIRYPVAYELMVNQYRQLINTDNCQATIMEGLELEPGAWEYPRGGKVWYWGVLATSRVMENLNG